MPKKKPEKQKRASDLTTPEAVERLFHPDMADAMWESVAEPADPNPDDPRRTRKKPTKRT
jgi:hypothetical protein